MILGHMVERSLLGKGLELGNPHKVVIFKGEVRKWSDVFFIYMVALIKWISNIIIDTMK